MLSLLRARQSTSNFRNIPQNTSKFLQKRTYKLIQSLRPEETTTNDLVDLSNLTSTRLHFFRGRPIGHLFRYTYHCSKTVPFPSSTKGLLYYHEPQPNAPLSTCRLQFRICDSPEKFSSGKDLLLPNGTPWVVSMWRMVSIGLAEQLVEKGMIDKERLEIFKNSAGTIQQRVPHTIIYALGQPFRYVVRHTRTDWADIAFAGESGKLVHLRASHSVKLRELLDLEVPGADKDKDDLVLSVYLDHDPENKRQPLVLRLAEDARAPYSEFLRKDMILPCLTLSKKSSHRFGDHYITSRLDDVLKILLPTKA